MGSLAETGLQPPVEVLNIPQARRLKPLRKSSENSLKKLSKTACQAGRSVYNTRPRFGGNLKRYQSPGGFELFKKTAKSQKYTPQKKKNKAKKKKKKKKKRREKTQKKKKKKKKKK